MIALLREYSLGDRPVEVGYRLCFAITRYRCQTDVSFWVEDGTIE
jgi:hypothetical protein